MKLNIEAVQQHLSFLLNIDNEYSDGRFEVSGLYDRNTSNFYIHAAEEMARYAEELNQSSNTYICGALLDPDIFPTGRSSDKDFYATQFVWADIDDEHDNEKLKELYAECPPNFCVVTARVPHRRVQLWWRLQECLTEPETLREALIGIAQNLGGDTKIINPTSLMRLGGTVNRPNDKKRAAGRVDEVTECYSIHDTSYSIDHVIAAFPIKRVVGTGAIQFDTDEVTREPVGTGIFNTEQVTDGRDKYMSDMVYASILSLTHKLDRWPEPQEVFDECWPTYERGAATRAGRSLEQDGRGKKAMSQKINSKLRAFINGFMRGFSSIEDVKKAGAKRATPSAAIPPRVDTHPVAGGVDHFDPETGEVAENAQNRAKSQPIVFIRGKDIKLSKQDRTLVKDVINKQELSVIYGESNCGKTFFMADLALHVARGAEWRGKRVEQGGVIYAALEGTEGFKKRYLAHCKHHSVGLDIPFSMMVSSLDFYSNENNIQGFVEAIKQEQDYIGDPALIVIDTLARALSGGDENSGQDMGRLVGFADYIRAETSAHLAFVHHSGKNKALGSRGHSSLRAAVDTEIEISREEGAAQSHIRFVKQREMEMIDSMAFGLKSIVVGHNGLEDVTSCVVVEAEIEETPGAAQLNAKEKFVLEVIKKAIEEHGVNKKPFKDGPFLRCITFTQLGDMLEEMGYDRMHNKDGESTALRATKTVRVSLRDKNLISFNGGLVWLLSY